ncbi:MAG: outer membrane beta-barrel protein [Ginsengibacter sp.]
MKTIRILLASFCTLLLLSQQATAQKGTLKLNLNYNYSIPVSGFNADLVSKASPRGFTGALMYTFNNKWDGGLAFGFQDYYQKYQRATYPLGKTQDISAVISNSIQTTPVLVKVTYAPFNTPSIRPYLSAGAGANLIDFKQYLGEFGSDKASVGIIAQCGLGVTLPFGKLKTSGIDVGANYSYAPYKKNGYQDLNAVNLHAGIYFQIK